jgi:hypothetical protein
VKIYSQLKVQKMGTNESLQKVVQTEFNSDSSPNATRTSFSNKFGHNLKRIVLVTSLTGAALFFNGCSAGYVATEPAYMQYDRPARPNEYAIWIEGDWNWSNRSQQYYQKNGYWDSPRQGQSYMAGYWQTTPKGKTWTKGHWHADDHQKDNHNHDKNHHQDSN